MAVGYDIFETPFGWVGLLASPSGLMRSTLPQSTPNRCIPILRPEEHGASIRPDLSARLRDKLVLYFSGARIALDDEPIDLGAVSPFLRSAWAACRSIPLGETRTYKWLAAQAGRPRAPRAAGQSMARNRLPIIVPCHRVVASDGSLGGFGAGALELGMKRRLLALEAGTA